MSSQVPAAIVTGAEFETLVRELTGLVVTRARGGLGGNVLVDFGERSDPSRRAPFVPHFDASWSIALGGRVLGGSSDHAPLVDRELQALVGDEVTSVELDSPLLDIAITFTSERVLKSFHVKSSRASWHVRLPDDRWLTAWQGAPRRLVRNDDPERNEDVTGEDWSASIAERFVRLRTETATSNCGTCAAWVRLRAPAKLLDFGVCARYASPFERRAVHRTSGCDAHVARTSSPVPGTPYRPEQVISRAGALALLAPLVGETITRTWGGLGSVFFELGELTRQLNGERHRGKGRFTLLIQFDWRVEVAWLVAFGSGSAGDFVERSLAHAVGTTVASVDIRGDVPQIVVRLSNGWHLCTATLSRGDPNWVVFLPEQRYVETHHGVLLCTDGAARRKDTDDPDAETLEEAAEARWPTPPYQADAPRCNACTFRVRLASHDPLRFFSCCTNPASPFDARVVHHNDVCSAFAPRD